VSGETPIQNPDAIDAVVRRDDGGVDLLILVSAPLSDTGEHQSLLLDKIDAYLERIESPDFRAEIGEPAPDRTRIVVQCAHPPHPMIRQILQRAVPWVYEHNATLTVRVGSEA